MGNDAFELSVPDWDDVGPFADTGTWNITTLEYPDDAPEGVNILYVYDDTPGDGTVTGVSQMFGSSSLFHAQ